MAKDNSTGAAVPFKVHLKPTDVGVHVMRRMERPHIDKSGELRKLIELGYAAEQAGFILDGTVLRHAGRAWDTQPDFTAERSIQEGPQFGSDPQRQPGAKAQRSRDEQSAAPASETAAPQDLVSSDRPLDDGSQGKGSMRDKLRGLSS